MKFRTGGKTLCEWFAISHFCFAALVAVTSLAAGQDSANSTVEYPATPAGSKLAQLIGCINEADEAARLPFLRDGFTAPEELEQREAISKSLHQKFAPLKLLKVIASDEHALTVHLETAAEVVLSLSLTLTNDSKHQISDIDMEPVNDDEPVQLPDGMVSIFHEDGSTLSAARGIWLADGYGYIMQVSEKKLEVFNVTQNFLWRQEFDEDLFIRRLDGTDSTSQQIVFTFHPLEPGYRMIRLQALPSDRRQLDEATPTDLFDLFVDLFEEHYPFFKTRNHPWEARKQKFRSHVHASMSESDLFDSMAGLIEDLDDGHVSLVAEIDGSDKQATTGGMDSLSLLRASFEPTEDTKTFGKYFRAWRDKLRQGIADDILSGKGKVVANDQITWGRVGKNIGYLAINGMGGYSYGAIDAQVAALHNSLNDVLTELADTEALIVDISFNGGGSDLYSLEIASHFADQKRLGFSKWPRDRPQYRQDRFVTPIQESDLKAVSYTKPIYLVTSDITASAAEIFTMCMRSMPHVTTVGMATEGALSDVLSKTLPNGWEVGLSNEIYVDHLGVSYEGPGIPPQIAMDVFDQKDITRVGHTEAIKQVVALALEGARDQ